MCEQVSIFSRIVNIPPETEMCVVFLSHSLRLSEILSSLLWKPVEVFFFPQVKKSTMIFVMSRLNIMCVCVCVA